MTHPQATSRWSVSLMLIAALALAAAAASAQEDGAEPAAADAQPLTVAVAAVQGPLAQVRADERAEWRRAEVGMEVGVGAEFRTGPRSAVQLAIGPEDTITLDRLGTIKVLQALREAGTIRTDIGMPYGRTRYQVEAGGLEHESNIHSPSAMLAIRGSDVTHQHDAFTSYAYGDGNLRFLNRIRRQAVAFGQSGVRARVTGRKMNPSDVARGEATVDGKGQFVARTDTEVELTETLPEVAGDDLRSVKALQKQVNFEVASAGFTLPPPDTFAVLLGWSGVFGFPPPTVNLDLSVTDPSGFTLSPAMVQSPDGRGRHSGDGVAVFPNNGNENVFYTRFLPGTYTIDVDLTEAPDFQPIGFALQFVQGLDGGPLEPVGGTGGVLVDPVNTNFQTQVKVPVGAENDVD